MALSSDSSFVKFVSLKKPIKTTAYKKYLANINIYLHFAAAKLNADVKRQAGRGLASPASGAFPA